MMMLADLVPVASGRRHVFVEDLVDGLEVGSERTLAATGTGSPLSVFIVSDRIDLQHTEYNININICFIELKYSMQNNNRIFV